MKKDLKVQPNFFPMPVAMIGTYGEDGSADVMNMAWGGINAMDEVTLNISPSHQTSKNILAKKAFTLAMADRAHMVEADFLGIVSAKKDPEKFEKSGLTAVKSAHVDAPVIQEFPYSLECEVIKIEEGAEMQVVGKIVNIQADEAILNDDGQVDLKKLDPILFDCFSSQYFTVGEPVGKCYNIGKKLM